MQEIYDRFGKISTVGSSYRNNTLTKCVGKGVREFKAPFPIGSSTFQVYRLTSVLDLRLSRCSNCAARALKNHKRCSISECHLLRHNFVSLKLGGAANVQNGHVVLLLCLFMITWWPG